MTSDTLAKVITIGIAEGRGVGDNLAVDFAGMPEDEFKRLRQFSRSGGYPQNL